MSNNNISILQNTKIAVLYKNSGHVTSNWIISQFKRDVERDFKVSLFDLNKDINDKSLYNNFSLVINFCLDNKRVIEILNKFKLNHVKIVTWLNDPDVTMHKVKRSVKISDLICFPFYETYKVYSNFAPFSGKSIYMPWAASRELINNYRINFKLKKKKITFFGTATGSRIRLINSIKQLKIPLETNIKINEKIRLNFSLKHYSFLIPKTASLRNIVLRLSVLIGGALNKIYQNLVFHQTEILSNEKLYSKISENWFGLTYGVHRNTDLTPFLTYEHIRLRDFEILSLGSILISSQNSDVDQLIKSGLKIYKFQDLNSLNIVAKNLFLKSRKSLILDVENNYNILLEKHTWSMRIKEILIKLNSTELRV